MFGSAALGFAAVLGFADSVAAVAYEPVAAAEVVAVFGFAVACAPAGSAFGLAGLVAAVVLAAAVLAVSFVDEVAAVAAVLVAAAFAVVAGFADAVAGSAVFSVSVLVDFVVADSEIAAAVV